MIILNIIVYFKVGNILIHSNIQLNQIEIRIGTYIKEVTKYTIIS
jgi:hypothetical protein